MPSASSPADISRLSNSTRWIETLTGFADEFRAIAARIMAYLCGLALLALFASDFVSRFQDEIDLSPRHALRESAWHQVERPIPAFAAPAQDLANKTATYEIQ